MVGVSKQKPFQKKKQQRPLFKKKRTEQKVKVNTRFLFFVMWVAILLMVFGYGTIFVLKRTIFSPRYLIQNVEYADDSVATYDDPYLYKSISEELKGKNYYLQKAFKKLHLSSTIHAQYPMVDKVKFSYTNPNEVIVQVSFFEPDILIKYQTRRFALLGDYTFELFSGSSLGGSGIQEIRLPTYLEGFDNLDGMFFDIMPTKLAERVQVLLQKFSNAEKIVYLPGSQRIIILMPEGKKIYINCIRSFDVQFASYDKLKKYYDGFSSLTEIDLGSLEEGKVIVKK